MPGLIGLTMAIIQLLPRLTVAVPASLAFILFAWEHAKQMGAKSFIDQNGTRVYELHGALFFGSIHAIPQLFDPKDDPDEVMVDFYDTRLADHSGLEAIDTLAERHLRAGRTLQLKHLNQECRTLLDKAGGLLEVNLMADPRYRIADHRLA